MSLLLKGATLIDGSGAAPRHDMALLIEGERISALGHSAEVVVPPGARVIDVTGKVVMPGLIDCHDHLAHTGFDLMERAAAPLSLTMMRIANNMKVTLEAGITTVRDMGGLDVGFKMAAEQGLIPGPRLLLALTIISRTGGIDDPRLRSGVEVYWKHLPGLPSPVCDGVEECRKRVREVLHAGADIIKCASTGGVSSQTLTATVPTMTLQELTVIVEEAHMVGKRTTVHAYGGPGLENAVKAGIDSVEHGAYLGRLPDTIERMVEQGTYFVPTFMVLALHREHASPFARQKAAELAEDHRRSFELAMEAGIPVAMGTDAGIYGYGHNARELRLLTEAGMSPMQAIVASTKTAAACLGLESEVGTLERGKYADLLVVDGDPLKNIEILEQPESIEMVIKAGQIYIDRNAPIAG